jgi:L-galactose dehydrogenase
VLREFPRIETENETAAPSTEQSTINPLAQLPMKIPRRDFGSSLDNNALAPSLPLIGLGCSSFSTFFWSSEESSEGSAANWTPESLDKDHPRVQAWIRTIHFAVRDCGINLLDTAPWYGHGTSEVVIGWAMETLQSIRQDIIINTKVGRYEADPHKQFDFSREATLSSVQQSLKRLRCQYIDVLQLHDPEFAPSLEQLMKETIPAMLQCRSNGWCRAIGITGYPLEVQFQILQRSMEDFGANIWDQALTYGHFNLHNSSLLNKSISSYTSFAGYCHEANVGILAAAPLSMGLLTHNGPPEWHPASKELASSCHKAATICKDHDVNISVIAIAFALSSSRIPCTILGCKDMAEVERAAAIANRFHAIDHSMSRDDILKQVLTRKEFEVYEILQNPSDGPFAVVWKNGEYLWDGIEAAHDFWKNVEGVTAPKWQEK